MPLGEHQRPTREALAGYVAPWRGEVCDDARLHRVVARDHDDRYDRGRKARGLRRASRARDDDIGPGVGELACPALEKVWVGHAEPIDDLIVATLDESLRGHLLAERRVDGLVRPDRGAG